MNENESKHLQELLTAFDIRALGEGDEIVGTNLLAAMAVTLANLAHPQSCIQTPDMRTIRVGCNLLVSGARLTNMIADEVVTPVRCCQESILAHVDRLIKNDEKQNLRLQRSLPRQWNFPMCSASSEGENSFMNLMIADSKDNFGHQSDDKSWLDVVSSPPSQDFLDVCRRPRAFIVAANPRMLESQLSSTHAGQALITIALNRAEYAGRFGDLCAALMNGTLPFGPVGETVRGKLLVTDPGNVLPDSAREAGDKTAWLGRLLWLISGNAGPELPLQQDRKENTVRLQGVAHRFECAAQKIFANRMNSSTSPLIYTRDFADTQSCWMTFLQSMESRLPGISGTARQLLASLEFGLRNICAANEIPEGFTLNLNGIEALARYLVLRMANARAAILFSAEEGQKLEYKQKILTALLLKGSLGNRAICRLLRRPMAISMPILHELVSNGLVTRREEKWELVKGADLPNNQYISIEV